MRTLPWLALLLAAPLGAQTPSIPAPFEKVVLTNSYLSEGASVGDFDRDGLPDVVSGPYWWAGPDFTTQRTIYPPQAFPVDSYADHFCSFVFDVNSDGWDDVISTGLPGQAAHWYENPRLNNTLWPEHLLFDNVDTESPALVQLIPGGLPELVCGYGSEVGYLSPDPASPNNPWIFRAVGTSSLLLTYFHGLGAGDVNGDGRLDVLTGSGWLEQPATLVPGQLWPWHPFLFGSVEGAQMFAYDVDGDGDNDLISGLDAHGYGLSWYEHVPVLGVIVFVEHEILPPAPVAPGMLQFSQLHALQLADVDGDGLQDLVTGKAYWAHNGTDPGATEPAVLYWFELQRSGGTATFVPHLIDSDSGVGRQIVTADVNGDGRKDVLVAGKKGAFVFRRSALWADGSQLSISAGGSQQFFLDGGVPSANHIHWIVGSMSGTFPGVNLGGLHLALNPDMFSSFVITARNSFFFTNFVGTLDAAGRGTAAFNLPPGLPFVGPLHSDYAFLLFTQNGALVRTSNTVGLTLF